MTFLQNGDMVAPIRGERSATQGGCAFLEICKHHPRPVQASDVRIALGMSTAAAPRHISRLSEKSWRLDKERIGREPGMGLIHKDEDRFDARKHVLSLTDKGKQVLEWINEI